MLKQFTRGVKRYGFSIQREHLSDLKVKIYQRCRKIRFFNSTVIWPQGNMTPNTYTQRLFFPLIFQNTKDKDKSLKGKITEFQKIEIKLTSEHLSPIMDAEDNWSTARL